MAISLTKNTAQKIVDTVKSVCGHDINFINTDGIIFASTDAARKGTFHEIGKKVVITKETIEVDSNDSFYGTHKGVNIPFLYNGEVIAVIGISGEPDKVRQYAVLAQKITYLILREQEIDSYNYNKKSQLNYVIRAIVENTSITHDYLDEFLGQHNVRKDTICRTVLIKLNSRYNLSNLSMIEIQLFRMFDHIKADLYTFSFPDEYILIIPETQYQRWSYIFSSFAMNYKEIVNIGVGSVSPFLKQSDSYSAAQMAIKSISGDRNIALFDDLDLEIIFSCVTDQAKRKYIEKTIAKLDDEQLELLRIYFSSGMSLKLTAETLFLHKNTLQYKLNGIEKTTGYNPRVFKDAVNLYAALKLLH